MRKPAWFYRQSGVVPYRRKRGEIEVLLVTSGGRRGRWIIPKGVIDPGTTPRQSACKEAYEEAGIRGRASRVALGRYRYDKWGGTCTVTVFALKVLTVLNKWPEDSLRYRQWMSVKEAAQSVKGSGLKKLIRRISDL